MSRRLGLIIGVNQYQDPAFQTLQFAENDARALAQWLVNEKGGKWAPADMQLVQGATVTRTLVESLITQMCLHQAEPGDLIFIYFAGHAFINEQNGEGYLAFSNTRYQDPATALHLFSFVQQVLARSRAGEIMVFLDCFQTGPAWQARRTSPYDASPLLGPATFNLLQQCSNRLFLCTCRGNGYAPEQSEQSLGSFIYRSIVGLCGPASDPATGTIGLVGLYKYLSGSLDEQHRPQIFGQETMMLPLVGTLPEAPALQQMSPHSNSAPLPPSGLLRTPQTASAPLPGNMQPAAASPSMGPMRQAPAATAQLSPSNPAPQSAVATLSEQQKQQIDLMQNQVLQLLQAQNYAEAYNGVEQILQLVPQDSFTLMLKAQILRAAGRLPEALSIIEQLTHLEPENPLIWSMRAVILSNLGQYEAALADIERSLELNPGNPETFSIKTNIMARMAEATSQAGQQPMFQKKQGGPLSFFIGLLIQAAGLILGLIGTALPIFIPQLPLPAAFAAIGLGTALLCVNAARGAYLYGFTRLLLTLVFCLLPAGILGGLYKLAYASIIARINANPTLLTPILLLAGWLGLVALLPLLLAIGGLIVGAIRGKRQ
ncbi:tetratricopeptide repeat protein [Ktedonosporobacter rubrisoli]|uniref:Tetratricopeptide repeat protein n=1 Tax=Ktedonosporobacter rubrisoli TaxID=2509675 RepID=A0A4P6JRI4_KTERU|nr:tetratricopeptide repeat protein [Ktedonosporobacter rubrisoli]QBD78087.1 tetratricopeptide repeat protein [Ktedonosporobacter rubrisoli]